MFWEQFLEKGSLSARVPQDRSPVRELLRRRVLGNGVPEHVVPLQVHADALPQGMLNLS